jgi:hypothetical protein
LVRCIDGCPIGVRVEVAIAAHRIAWAQYEADGMEGCHRLAMYTIRAVIVAGTSAN